jgi:RNA polymerase sigma factor (sigma-70 family)
LVAAVRQGDERAFEALYDRYHQPLLGFCRHMLGTREEAEDALQHVFVAAHRHLRQASGPIHLKAWLYTIARNRCVSMLRARRDAVPLEPMHEPSTDGLGVAAHAERREELEELLGDLARLPDDQRAALVLAELGDLSHEEIGVALGVRTDKVKALMFQARDTLGGWRQARTADCHDIQEQLATLRGSALRRATLRRHVAVCPLCAAFEQEVSRQRTAMALLLPVVPSVALKSSVLSAALSVGHEAAGAAGAAAAAGAAGAGGLPSVAAVAGGATGLTAKALAVTALVVGAGGAGAVAIRALDPPPPLARPAATAPAKPSAAGTVRPGASGVAPGAERSAAARSGSHGPASPTQRPKGATRGRSATAPGHIKPRKAHGRATQPKVNVHGRGTGKAKMKATRPVTPATSRRPDAVKAPTPVAPKAVAPKLPPAKAPTVERSAGAPAPAAAPRVKPVTPAAAPDAKGAGTANGA